MTRLRSRGGYMVKYQGPKETKVKYQGPKAKVKYQGPKETKVKGD